MSNTMIESVAVRQRGSYDFETHYNNLCALQSSCPLPAVKSHLEQHALDINGDRIRAVDWMPILGTVRINKTLEFVALRSYFQQTMEEQEGRNYRRKTPAIRSKEITYRVCKALKDCLLGTPCLSCIELQGLPLRERDMAALAKGIHQNRSLKHLSLEHSRIGDEGLETLAKGLRNSPSIASLNLTGCSLTSKGAEILAKLIKHQAMKRHNEAWQDSLRYRRPDLDRMSGIRRITANTNPMMGDHAAKVLAEALKDDLWLKALDMQQCGLTDAGAQSLLDTLKFNTCIVVLDIRQNPMTNHELIKKIIEHLTVNSYGNETEYKWIKAEPLQDPAKIKNKKKRTKTLLSNFGKRATIKVMGSGGSGSGGTRRRSKSCGTPSRPMQAFVAGEVKAGLPWRTALRANRFKGYPPDESPTKQQSGGEEAMVSIMAGEHTTVRISAEESSDDTTVDSMHALRGTVSDTDVSTLKDIKAVKVEIEQLKRRLRDEKRARTRADERIIELTLENSRLKQEVDDQRAKQGILDDDAVLDSIERSFQQFHQFLELLRDAGLGQLITLAGIDQSSMPFSAAPLPDPSLLSKSERLMNLTTGLNGGSDPNTPTTSAPPPTSTAEPMFSDSFQAMVRQANAGRGMSYTTNGVPAHVNNPAAGDPTMNSQQNITSSIPKDNKFDDLYSKVLRETEGILDGSARQQQQQQQHHADGDGDDDMRRMMMTNGNNSNTKQHKSQQQQKSAGSVEASPRNDVASDQGSFRSAASHSSGGKPQRAMMIEDLQPAGQPEDSDEDEDDIEELLEQSDNEDF